MSFNYQLQPKKYTLITKKLYDAIESSSLKPVYKKHAYRFINHLFYLNNINSDKMYTKSFVDISSLTLRERFTKDYNKFFMESFRDSKIIIKRPYYNDAIGNQFNGNAFKENKPYGYKINPELLDFSELVQVEFDKKPVSHKNKQIVKVIDDLIALELDIEGMIGSIMSYNLDDEIRVIDDLSDEAVELVISDKEDKRKVYVLSTADALARAKGKDMDLIVYKNKYYTSKLGDFKRNAIRQFRISQLYTISTLISKDFYAARNKTNNRLDHNLTNLKSTLLKGYVKLDGEHLVDVDLSNSQPCLLAYLISSWDKVQMYFPDLVKKYKIPDIDSAATDLALFLEKSGDGKLYDFLAEKLGWDRDLAKLIFIKIMFSKPKWNSRYKKQIRAVFPTIINFMDDFKVQNGKPNQLAIFLQKLEAKIFIDNIYNPIRKEGYVIFSKHDSILCKESQRDEIKLKMEEILDGFGLQFRLK